MIIVFNLFFNFAARAEAIFNVSPVGRKRVKHDVIQNGPIGMHSRNNWPHITGHFVTFFKIRRADHFLKNDILSRSQRQKQTQFRSRALFSAFTDCCMCLV